MCSCLFSRGCGKFLSLLDSVIGLEPDINVDFYMLAAITSGDNYYPAVVAVYGPLKCESADTLDVEVIT